MHFSAARQVENRRIGACGDRRSRSQAVAGYAPAGRSLRNDGNRLWRRRQAHDGRRLERRLVRIGRWSSCRNAPPVDFRPPPTCRRAATSKSTRPAGHRRILLKLVGAQSADLVGLHADSLLAGVEARVGQIDHQPRRIAQRLDRGNQRLGGENLDRWTILLLNDPKALDRGVSGRPALQAQPRSVHLVEVDKTSNTSQTKDCRYSLEARSAARQATGTQDSAGSTSQGHSSVPSTIPLKRRAVRSMRRGSGVGEELVFVNHRGDRHLAVGEARLPPAVRAPCSGRECFR